MKISKQTQLLILLVMPKLSRIIRFVQVLSMRNVDTTFILIFGQYRFIQSNRDALDQQFLKITIFFTIINMATWRHTPRGHSNTHTRTQTLLYSIHRQRDVSGKPEIVGKTIPDMCLRQQKTRSLLFIAQFLSYDSKLAPTLKTCQKVYFFVVVVTTPSFLASRLLSFQGNSCYLPTPKSSRLANICSNAA